LALPDSATLVDTYGGPYTNQQPVEDPTTEIDADFDNEALADTAACTRMVERAWVSFVGVTYTSGSQSITVADHDAVWGGGVTVLPTIVQTAAGIYTITWPATVEDEIGVTRTLNIRRPFEPTTEDATLSRVKVTGKTANTLSLKAFNAALAADSLNGITIHASWS
jgi:hypothetical protein